MFVQALYERIFSLLVSRINRETAVNLQEGAATAVISVVDIYGFEVFELNRYSLTPPSPMSNIMPLYIINH